MTDVAVVIPTLNEAPNIEGVVTDVLARNSQPEVIVVDDGSTDGTREIVEKYADEPGCDVRLLHRPDGNHLATAVLDGWSVANADIYSVIDGDGQHDARMLELCHRHVYYDADMAIASRHLRCSASGKVMPAHRSLVSEGAKFLARLAEGKAWGTSDPLSGCFAVQASLVDAVWTDLDPVGYKIGLEVMARCDIDSVADVPYQFQERTGGESNMDMAEVVKYLRHLWRVA